jgi:hypothetical protein
MRSLRSLAVKTPGIGSVSHAVATGVVLTYCNTRNGEPICSCRAFLITWPTDTASLNNARRHG